MSISTTLILGAAVALPLFIASLVARARQPSRTTLIPKSQERVVIIGASSGIGAELARTYARRNAHVVLVARRVELLQQLVQELNSVAASIHAIQGDVALAEDVRRITIESLKALQGGVDTLMICAGIISVLPFHELAGIVSGSEQDFLHLLPNNSHAALDASFRINYHAPLNLACHFLPSLTRTSVAGNIIVVSSMAGKVGAPTRSIYSASKHAAQGFFDLSHIRQAAFVVGAGEEAGNVEEEDDDGWTPDEEDEAALVAMSEIPQPAQDSEVINDDGDDKDSSAPQIRRLLVVGRPSSNSPSIDRLTQTTSRKRYPQA
ncbi:hypothetical protein BGZ65_007147 [Modicella reniformis]|uniref:NAD(P)-binding protein n=1 Tax=Modicella reniformis TaxID=1440133 RepID=A0A9P6IVH6_9FUNG|nr:hypothetical protein BGZ65_007147 [Modicella reniformis]